MEETAKFVADGQHTLLTARYRYNYTHEFSTYLLVYQVPVGNGTCRYGSNQVVHYNYISNSEKIRDK